MTTVKPPNKTASLFMKINHIGLILGLPNIWNDGDNFPTPIRKFYGIYRYASLVVILIFISFELAAIFTQKNLSEKQSGDMVMFGFSHPILLMWIIVTEWKKERIKNLLYQLAIVLKENYNDEEVETVMVMKAKRSSAGYSALFMMALALYGYDGVMQVIRREGTFTTVITFWPDVRDTRWPASLARLVAYALWWMFMTRVCVVYVTVIATLITLSHQFKNLQSYFYSLEGIFEEDLSQEQKEEKYEEGFKLGVKMHSETLWCTKECQETYDLLFSCQVLTAVSVLVMLMSQMVNSDRTLENILSIVSTGSAMLISTGFFMWNAGDVTVEAAAMATAMYSSGWHHCQHSARRVRGLMIITMTLSQRPVIIWALGIVELSYRSYVSLVKSSYSVFSVII